MEIDYKKETEDLLVRFLAKAKTLIEVIVEIGESKIDDNAKYVILKTYTTFLAAMYIPLKNKSFLFNTDPLIKVKDDYENILNIMEQFYKNQKNFISELYANDPQLFHEKGMTQERFKKFLRDE